MIIVIQKTAAEKQILKINNKNNNNKKTQLT